MNTLQLLNKVIEKWGHDRPVIEIMDDRHLRFTLPKWDATFCCHIDRGGKNFKTMNHIGQCDNYSKWVDAILRDKRRDESGAVVEETA